MCPANHALTISTNSQNYNNGMYRWDIWKNKNSWNTGRLHCPIWRFDVWPQCAPTYQFGNVQHQNNISPNYNTNTNINMNYNNNIQPNISQPNMNMGMPQKTWKN